MNVVRTREQMTREERVSFVLRQCALLVDPRNGYLKSLADVLEIHEVTLSVWIKQGYVPFHQAKKLQKRFGKKRAPVDELCPTSFRRT